MSNFNMNHNITSSSIEVKDWVESTANSTMYPSNTLVKQKSMALDMELLIVFTLCNNFSIQL